MSAITDTHDHHHNPTGWKRWAYSQKFAFCVANMFDNVFIEGQAGEVIFVQSQVKAMRSHSHGCSINFLD